MKNINFEYYKVFYYVAAMAASHRQPRPYIVISPMWPE